MEFSQCSKQGPKPGNFENKALCGQPYVHTDKWLEYSTASTMISNSASESNTTNFCPSQGHPSTLLPLEGKK